MRRARRGFYAPRLPGAPTTTRQAEILNTAVVGAPTDEEGVVIGEDRLSRSIVAGDPFTAYSKRLVDSPNVVIAGDVGVGKSTLLKTCYLLRPLILRGRQIVVFDRKDQGGAGEYTALTERWGATPIGFRLDGTGQRINLLDRSISDVDGPSGTVRLVRAVAETMAERRLDDWETKALRTGLRAAFAAAEGDEREPVLLDLVDALPRVADSYGDVLSPAARERLHQAGATVMFVLDGLLEEYSGLFDGPTSEGIDLATGRLTSFDLSQLPSTGPAASMVVAAAQMWLLGRLRRDRGKYTYVDMEEGWDLIGGANGYLWRSLIKLARGLGVSTVTAIHKLGDIPKNSPAYAIIQEAGTVHVFRQSRAEDQVATLAAFDLKTAHPASLGQLPAGDHLYKVGSAPEVRVRHVRTPWEQEVTDTDEAMTALTGGRR